MKNKKIIITLLLLFLLVNVDIKVSADESILNCQQNLAYEKTVFLDATNYTEVVNIARKYYYNNKPVYISINENYTTNELFLQIQNNLLVDIFKGNNSDDVYQYTYDIPGIRYIPSYDKSNNLKTIAISISSVNFGYFATNYTKYNNYFYSILDSLDLENLSSYDKIVKISNYIVDKYEYDYTYKNNSIYALMNYNTTVCAGYSTLFYNLTNRCGLNCIFSYGTSLNNPHVWNLIKLNDNKWYYVDLTFDDSSKSTDYFLKGSTEFLRTHITSEAETKILSELNISDSDYTLVSTIKPVVKYIKNKNSIKFNLTLNDSTSYKVYINNKLITKNNIKSTYYIYLKNLKQSNNIKIIFNDEYLTTYIYEVNKTKLSYNIKKISPL